MTIKPLGQNVLIEVDEMSTMSAGGIDLSHTAMSTGKNELHVGRVVGVPEFEYHPDGTLKSNRSIKHGMTVCFMKGGGSTVPNAPEGKDWRCVPADCINYVLED